MAEQAEGREGSGDRALAAALTAHRHAELVSEARGAELAVAVEGVARVRGELHAVSVQLQTVSAELEAVRSDLAAARAEIDQLRLPAARYERMRDLVPEPVRRLAMAVYDAIVR